MWATLTFFCLTQTASDSLASAHADLARLPAQTRLYTRYLSLHTIAEKDRPEAIRVLAGHVQHLSRASDLTRPGSVAGGMLLRVNLLDYGWTSEIWEKLLDPYFSIQVGKEYHPAPWLGDRETLAEVVAWTGSWVPVVSAEWFFNATATAEGGRHYYEFLGVKTVADVEKLIGFDRKQVEAIRVELREAVSLSGVTRRARAIARWDSISGPYWVTYDFKETKVFANPLEVLGRDIEKFKDGSEAYFTLPNYFWGMYGANEKDVLVGSVPTTIATDHFAKGNFKEVMPLISCLRCHSEGGLQPIDGWVRNLLNPPLELRVKDEKKYRELKQNYLRRLEPFLVRDQERYREAVKEATGMEPKVFQKAFVKFWEAYEDAQVDLAFAARRIGVTPDVLKGKILAEIKRGGYVSPVTSGFVHEGPRKRAVDIRQFELVIPEMHKLVGYPK